MECRQVRELHLKLLAGRELTPEEREELTSHARHCEACCELLETIEEDDAGEEVHPIRAADDPVVKQLVARVLQQTGDAVGPAVTRGWREAVRRGLKRLKPVAAAAAIFVLVLLHFDDHRRLTEVSKQHAQLAQDQAVRAAEREVAILRDQLADARHALDRQASQTAGLMAMVDTVYSPRQEQALSMVSKVYLQPGQDRISLRPSEIPSLLRLVQGLTLFSSGNYEGAIRAFRQASEGFTDSRFRIMSLFALGTSLETAGLHEETLSVYDSVLRLTEGDPKATAYLAQALHFRAWAYYQLAQIAADKGLDDQVSKYLTKAEQGYDAALRAVPNYPKVHYNKGILLHFRAELARKRGDNGERDRLLAAAAQELGKTEAMLKQRLATNPKDGRAFFTLAILYASQHKDLLALQHLTKAAEIDVAFAVLVPKERVFRRLAENRETRDAYSAILQKAGTFSGATEAFGNIFFDEDISQNAPAGNL